MKKLVTKTILSFITGMSFGQIDGNITKASWKPGKEKFDLWKHNFSTRGEE